MALAQAKSHAYQLQDLECGKCRQVKRSHLATRCDVCAGPFVLRTSSKSVTDELATFANIAEHAGFKWLGEVVSHLRR